MSEYTEPSYCRVCGDPTSLCCCTFAMSVSPRPTPAEATAERGPYVVDYCHGMVGGPAVIGPTGVMGFMQGRENDAKAEALCARLNAGWSVLGKSIENLREKRADLEAALQRVTGERDDALHAIRDIDRHATPYGANDPIVGYVVSAGSIHRALASVGGQAKCALLACPRAEAAEARLREVEQAIERLRGLWPHIEIGVRGERHHPGIPTCLRCKIEEAIGADVR